MQKKNQHNLQLELILLRIQGRIQEFLIGGGGGGSKGLLNFFFWEGGGNKFLNIPGI